MYTRKLRVPDNFNLALRKANFEIRMYRGVLTFLIEEHLGDENDDFLASEEYQKAFEDYTMKYLQYAQICTGVSLVLLGSDGKGIDYDFVEDYHFIIFSSDEPFSVDPQYENVKSTAIRRFVSFTDFIAKCYPTEKELPKWQNNHDRILTRIEIG